MDVVDNILASMGDHQGSAIKKENLSFDHLPEEVFKRAPKADKKPSFKCPICGKIYTERKPFVSHKSNHRRTKKLKELGVHPFNKVGCLKLKASTTSDTQLKKTEGNINNSEVDKKWPLKLMINSDISVHSMSQIQGDAKNFKFESVSNADKVSHSDYKQSYKCSVCGKIYTEQKMFAHHIKNHRQNNTFEELGQPSNVDNFISTTSVIDKEMGAISNTEVKEAKGNTNNSEVAPVKVMINPGVTANPMSCAGDWMPLETLVEPCQLVELSSENSTKVVQINAKKTSYKCNICDRIFTQRKTFLNHKTNHTQNKKKHKFLFYERPNK